MGIVIKWRQVADMPAGRALDVLCETSMAFGGTTISDYAIMPGDACTGLYFFFRGTNLAYVGKSTSRAFIERIPSHLDFRPGSWFGTLLQKLVGKGQNPDKESLKEALAYKVVLLAIGPDEGIKVGDLETSLRRLWQPFLNAARTWATDSNVTLKELARHK